jgi:hypothetical protein
LGTQAVLPWGNHCTAWEDLTSPQISRVRALFSTPSSLSLGDRADRGEVKPEVVANLLKLLVIKTNGIVDTRIAI